MKLPGSSAVAASSFGQTIRKLTPILGASPRRLAALVVVDLGSAVLEAAILIILVRVGTVVAADGAGGDLGLGPLGSISVNLAGLILLALAATAVRFGLKAAEAFISPRMSNEVMLSLRRRAVAAFLRSNWETQAQVRFGHMAPLLGNQINRVAQLTMQSSAGIGAAIGLIVLVAATLAVDVFAAAVILTAMVVLFFLLRPLSSRARRYSMDFAIANKTIGVATHELVAVALEAKVLGVEPEIEQRIDRTFRTQSASYVRTQIAGRLVPAVYEGAGLALILGALALFFYAHLASVSSLAAISLLFYRALRYGQALQGVYHSVVDTMPFIELTEDAIADWEAGELVVGQTPVQVIERIELDGVGYSYDGETFAVSDLTFVVPQGECVGIIGPSGAGKSTLIQLLLGLRQPTVGSTAVNGIPIRDIAPADWSRLLAYVPQDTNLVGDTVRENIRFFRPDITDADVEDAARRVGLHDEILARPGGYDAMIDDKHDTMSGGQRQRISIARALVGRPAVLILDEPTSALDLHSEQVIHSALRELQGHVTMFIVAHRLSTLNICDRIMVLEAGVLRGFEASGELRASSDFYREALALSGIEAEPG